jgi:RNA polymerase sigma-70 factor (ECF subfamily)
MKSLSEDRSLPEPFVRELLASQGAIYAYAMSLLGKPQQAEEVLQETNVVLCRQAEEFPNVTDFTAWACRIAYFQVLTYRKRRQRDRHCFNDNLLGLLAEEASSHAEEFARRQRALAECLEKLPDKQRDMVMQRYSAFGSVQAVAQQHGRTPGAIRQTLFRVRTALLKCIEHRVAQFERGCQ